MSSVMSLHILAAAAPTKSANGGLGLVVVFAIGVVVFFLLRSMTRHLRKVDRMKAEGVFDSTSSKVSTPPPPSRDDS
jgi:hypothetical protein